jgi:hypothetical protein
MTLNSIKCIAIITCFPLLFLASRVTMFRDPSDPYLSLSVPERGTDAGSAKSGDRTPLDSDQTDKNSEQYNSANRSSKAAKSNLENITPNLSARRIAINKWRLAKRKMGIIKKTILKRWFVVVHHLRHGAHPVFDTLNYLPKAYFESRGRLVLSLLSLALAGYITFVYKLPS